MSQDKQTTRTWNGEVSGKRSEAGKILGGIDSALNDLKQMEDS